MLLLEKFEIEALCRLHSSSDGDVLRDILRRELNASKDSLVSAGGEIDVRQLQGKAQAHLELLEALEKPHERMEALKRQEARPRGVTP